MNKFSYAFSWMKKRRPLFVMGILLQGLVSFLSMYIVAEFIFSITETLTKGGTGSIIIIMLRLFIGYLIVIALTFIGMLCTAKACLYATMELRRDIVKKILLAKVSSLNGRSSEEVINAFTSDISSIFDNMANVVAIPVNILFVGIGGIGYILLLDSDIGYLILLFGLAKIIYGLFFANKMKKISRDMLNKRAGYTSSVKQLLDHPISIRMFDMEKELRLRYEKGVDNLRRCNIHNGDVSGILGAINNVTTEIFGKLVLFISGRAVFSGDYELPNMMKQREIASNAVGIFSISRILTDAQIVLVGTERVIDFTESLEKEATGDYTGIDMDFASPYAIEYSKVAFRYGEKLLLEDLSVSIPKGNIAVIRGESGSGKTTMLRLAQGIYLPESGDIKILGRKVNEWNLHFLRERMAYVPQQVLFFEGSIAENIAGKLGASDLMLVEEAAKEALIYDRVMELSQAFDTRMTDNDGHFSGGEQKRLALAGAFYKKSDLLLLDEMTASVDTESERLIYDILKSRRGKQTVLFATHRILAEQIADQIIELA